MKTRTRRQLDRMHVWTHRRFHDATEPRFWRYWLAVRTKIIDLIVQASRKIELAFDEWVQIAMFQKVAADLGYKDLSWEKTSAGLIMAMGRSNEQEAESGQKRPIAAESR